MLSKPGKVPDLKNSGSLVRKKKSISNRKMQSLKASLMPNPINASEVVGKKHSTAVI